MQLWYVKSKKACEYALWGWLYYLRIPAMYCTRKSVHLQSLWLATADENKKVDSSKGFG